MVNIQDIINKETIQKIRELRDLLKSYGGGRQEIDAYKEGTITADEAGDSIARKKEFQRRYRCVYPDATEEDIRREAISYVKVIVAMKKLRDERRLSWEQLNRSATI